MSRRLAREDPRPRGSPAASRWPQTGSENHSWGASPSRWPTMRCWTSTNRCGGSVKTSTALGVAPLRAAGPPTRHPVPLAPTPPSHPVTKPLGRALPHPGHPGARNRPAEDPGRTGSPRTPLPGPRPPERTTATRTQRPSQPWPPQRPLPRIQRSPAPAQRRSQQLPADPASPVRRQETAPELHHWCPISPTRVVVHPPGATRQAR